jgi:oligopeptide/dipeptide ABC transporter ATP-binding protein
MPMFRVDNLAVDFAAAEGVVAAVKGVSLQIERGECVGIVGESGSGKSQLFLAVMGLLAANGTATGSASLDGRPLLNMPTQALNLVRGEDVGMVFQDPLSALTPHLRIEQQMIEVLQVHRRLGRREARARCIAWLERMRIPDASRRMKQYPHELSGGMRQRVMVAMAMLCEPKLLIADEPTTALDVTVQAQVLDLMSGMQRELGAAIALITHDMGVVARMCDRVIVMRDGMFVEQGTIDDIFYRPTHDYTRTLLDAMPRIDSSNRRQVAPQPQTLLDVKDLRVEFPVSVPGTLFGRKRQLKAVDGVSFRLVEGETLGIVGESGCGKSTLARAVIRLIEYQQGSVSWLGRDLGALKRQALVGARKDLQIVFQDPLASLNPRMTIADSIAEPLTTFRPDLTRREKKIQVFDIMERVGLLPAMANRYPHELSGGQNQRVGIARAMINRPALMICDEAVSALDVSIQAQIIELLKDLQSEFGLSMLFISHDLSVVRDISDRIMVIYLGRIVESGSSDQICSAPQHPYTQALISAVPVPDPAVERSRTHIHLPGELPSPLDPQAALRFLPTKVAEGELSYVPKLNEVSPGHFVAEHDPMDKIMAWYSAS